MIAATREHTQALVVLVSVRVPKSQRTGSGRRQGKNGTVQVVVVQRVEPSRVFVNVEKDGLKRRKGARVPIRDVLSCIGSFNL